MTVDHIVWDWNGTLLGDSPALISATISAFEACGLPPITRADYRRHHTQPIPLFYSRLAGRELADDEQARLAECFLAAYAQESVTLTADALAALGRWAASGGRQSLLSMYPHAALQPLVTAAGIDHFFTRIDGSEGPTVSGKAPGLRRHLRAQDIDPARALLIGDSVDDVRAAAACGLRCIVYHAGDDALHDRAHFDGLGAALAPSLLAAVDLALLG
jgi:phosphoglycolate phosphatase-like HAD superfamily hydrolase